MPRFVTDPAEPLKGFDGDGEDMGFRIRTVPEAFDEKVARHGALPALRVKRTKEQAEWTQWTWAEYQQEVHAMAKAMISIGLGEGDAVNVLAANAPEWFFAAMGAIHAGGMGVGLYITNTPAACQYQLVHSKAKVVFVDNNMQLEKVQAVRSECSELTHVVHWGADSVPTEGVLSFQDFVALGAGVSDEVLKARMAGLHPHKCCYLSYTSGTTANPKGVMYSHDSLLFAFHSIFKRCFDDLESTGVVLGEEERGVSYLPLSHIAGNVDLLGTLAMAPHINSIIHFAFPDAMQGSLSITMKDVQPTLFVGVPRVYEKLMAGLQAAAKANPKLDAAPPAMVAGLIGLGQCKHALVGAAPMQLPVFDFFSAKAGLSILEICGMTENAACQHTNTVVDRRAGSVGKVCPGTEVKLAEETAEICCRGRNVMLGYLYDEEKTAAAIDEDGWLHTGDVGTVDADGFCSIVGRIKELIITAGGENIPPVLVENAVKKAGPALANVMAVGDRQKYVTALITVVCKPNGRGGWLDELDGAAAAVDPAITKASEVPNSAVWKAYIDKAVADGNAEVISRAAQVKKWAVLPGDFAFVGEAAELTPTMKLKREVVHRKHADVIMTLYGADYAVMPWIPAGRAVDTAAPASEAKAADTTAAPGAAVLPATASKKTAAEQKSCC